MRSLSKEKNRKLINTVGKQGELRKTFQESFQNELFSRV